LDEPFHPGLSFVYSFFFYTPILTLILALCLCLFAWYCFLTPSKNRNYAPFLSLLFSSFLFGGANYNHEKHRINIVTLLRNNWFLNKIQRPLKIFFFGFPLVFIIGLILQSLFPVYPILNYFIGVLAFVVSIEAIFFPIFGIRVIPPFFLSSLVLVAFIFFISYEMRFSSSSHWPGFDYAI